MIKTFLLANLLLISAAPLANAAEDAGGAIKEVETAKGDVLADAKGMTLYTFDKDKNGEPACYDACARKWPPLLAAKGAEASGEFTLVKRHDGTLQWAHEGMPLYLFQNDAKPGDITGDGFGGVWHVAKD
ncbi:hypothetical protein BJF92_21450 [Rhizobium rhizosphaerae]|uniref:Lipoprotein with Yx(FWY)xxD motif n=1 Tax=Xaviernesmea rhizosphaerae TaxID=1672749 RepID=A0A1Q9AP32_9HYPH|nr:hypothetical protein [Xaviernesmea rhizosphaerae]OLP57067.1 hypothetical protein BJF92_21450 [Xaviernesmea rhizosphaerae]OQP87089.1 hypothetical protein BTR14_06520 [Xaviernesmea rhizosphaerae]